ncbi:MAG: glycoside hydrolase family 99-like domain-containing protein [FCB group bacterium]|jgi:hypothetical protein|nr:glycoside hydrolase family 99-like domain-containing protein [FCB group bacterium]
MSAYVLALVLAAGLPSWTFDDPTEAEAWEANAFLTGVEAKDGILRAEAIDWDPFFTIRGLEFPAAPWQYIRLRIKSDKSGQGQIFWTGATEGPYGGFDPNKTTPFNVVGDNEWHDVIVLPFWQTEKVIRQLRLDVYDGAHFEFDTIAIEAWDGGENPDSATYTWPQDSIATSWKEVPGTQDRFAPPRRLDVKGKGWAAVTVQSTKAASASLLWSAADEPNLKTQDFELRGDNRPHTYNLEMSGIPAWQTLVALGLRLPSEATLQGVTLSDTPSGPPEIDVDYLGFENAVNRVGRECTVVAQLANRGGESAEGLKATLNAPKGVTLLDDAKKDVPRIDLSDEIQMTWRVKADTPGVYAAQLALEGVEVDIAPAQLNFLAAVDVPKADYVPEPKPIATTAEVCAYYFPGWEKDAKWDCIREVAPIRKPLLGYYDESNPECVDWQIKWAVENGISCFLVDWYWTAGQQHLTHWFDAYRKARYRDQLKVAIMWANHNAPKTHSREDWRNVTKEWIDHYFNLPGYYRIDGKPAVFIWAPGNVRNDLGGSAEVKAAFDESQQMAKAAGYDGIVFAAMNAMGPPSDESIRILHDEGYVGVTSYHEWGDAGDLAPDPKHWNYQDVVDTVVPTWTAYKTTAANAGVTYYPVVETGWDARPWHGNKMQVIEGRTPERFEALLRKSKEFIGSEGRPIVILSPVNEWGEGSYIEPAVEYDFGMYEAIRNVFGAGDPASWPLNLSPADVGRGPYDYPKLPPVVSWDFKKEAPEWRPMMEVSTPAIVDGALRFKTLGSDPALTVVLDGVRAAEYRGIEFTMQLTGTLPENPRGQIFWSSNGANTSEATSIGFPLQRDGQPHTYTLDLAAHPRWRGKIASLRFDPCTAANVEATISDFRLTR